MTGSSLGGFEGRVFQTRRSCRRYEMWAPCTTDRIAVVVLGKGRWRLIGQRLPEIAAAVAAATSGSFADVEISVDSPR
jgi:hypothetical protein